MMIRILNFDYNTEIFSHPFNGFVTLRPVKLVMTA